MRYGQVGMRQVGKEGMDPHKDPLAVIPKSLLLSEASQQQ